MLNDAIYQVIKEAGQMMLSYHQPAVYRKDGHANFVTEADEAVQAFLIDRLHKLVPDAEFLAEEGEKSVLTDNLTFIIDPIDGTTNYFRGRRASLISVGVVEGKKPIAGAIWNPYTGNMYHAEKGQGAYCDLDPIHVSEFPLSDALIELGSAPYRIDLTELTAHTLAVLLPRIADIRRSGAAVQDLCSVASGHSEGMFEWNLQPWDFCAATLLVEEAGGKTGNILGGPATFDCGIPYMAANAACFDQLQELLQKIHRGEL